MSGAAVATRPADAGNVASGLRVVVPSSAARRGYEFKGQRYSEQEAAIFNGHHYPVPFVLTVKEGNEYPQGDYIVDPASVKVNERGRLVFGSIRLLPLRGSSK